MSLEQVAVQAITFLELIDPVRELVIPKLEVAELGALSCTCKALKVHAAQLLFLTQVHDS